MEAMMPHCTTAHISRNFPRPWCTDKPSKSQVKCFPDVSTTSLKLFLADASAIVMATCSTNRQW